MNNAFSDFIAVTEVNCTNTRMLIRISDIESVVEGPDKTCVIIFKKGPTMHVKETFEKLSKLL